MRSKATWVILQKNDIDTSNSLRDIKQNHWTMKYRLLTYIYYENKGHVSLIHYPQVWHSSNSIRDVKQNQWTMKYRSLWPTFFFRSKIMSQWLIISKYYIHPSNSLQDIKQNHRTVTCRSCSPWLYNPWVNVIKSSDAWPTTFINCLHNRKAEKHFLKVSYILTTSPTLWHGPRSQVSWNESKPSRVTMYQIWEDKTFFPCEEHNTPYLFSLESVLV